MDVSLYALFGVAAALGVNQMLLRVSIFRESQAGFLAVQSLNITMSVFILVFGLPGYAEQPAVSWVVGLLFLVHAGQNGRMQSRWDRSRRQRLVAERSTRAEDIREALRRHADEDGEA